MFEYFGLSVNGPRKRQYEIALQLIGNKVFYRIECLNTDEYLNENSIPLDSEWIKSFDALNINKWNQDYITTNLLIKGGYAWDLGFKEEDKAIVSIEGYNKYPDNWNQMIMLLDLLDPKANIKELIVNNN